MGLEPEVQNWVEKTLHELSYALWEQVVFDSEDPETPRAAIPLKSKASTALLDYDSMHDDDTSVLTDGDGDISSSMSAFDTTGSIHEGRDPPAIGALFKDFFAGRDTELSDGTVPPQWQILGHFDENKDDPEPLWCENLISKYESNFISTPSDDCEVISPQQIDELVSFLRWIYQSICTRKKWTDSDAQDREAKILSDFPLLVGAVQSVVCKPEGAYEAIIFELLETIITEIVYVASSDWIPRLEALVGDCITLIPSRRVYFLILLQRAYAHLDRRKANDVFRTLAHLYLENKATPELAARAVASLHLYLGIYACSSPLTAGSLSKQASLYLGSEEFAWMEEEPSKDESTDVWFLCNDPQKRMNILNRVYDELPSSSMIRAQVAYIKGFDFILHEDSVSAEASIKLAIEILDSMEIRVSNSVPLISDFGINCLIAYADVAVSNNNAQLAMLALESASNAYTLLHSNEFHEIYRRLASLCEEFGDYSRSLFYNGLILQRSLETSNITEFVFVSQQISKLCILQGDFSRAEDSLLEAQNQVLKLLFLDDLGASTEEIKAAAEDPVMLSSLNTILMKLAQLYIDGAKYDEAIRILKNAQPSKGKLVDVRMLLAKALYLRGDSLLCLQVLEELESANPDHDILHRPEFINLMIKAEVQETHFSGALRLVEDTLQRRFKLGSVHPSGGLLMLKGKVQMIKFLNCVDNFVSCADPLSVSSRKSMRQVEEDLRMRTCRNTIISFTEAYEAFNTVNDSLNAAKALMHVSSVYLYYLFTNCAILGEPLDSHKDWLMYNSFDVSPDSSNLEIKESLRRIAQPTKLALDVLIKAGSPLSILTCYLNFSQLNILKGARDLAYAFWIEARNLFFACFMNKASYDLEHPVFIKLADKIEYVFKQLIRTLFVFDAFLISKNLPVIEAFMLFQDDLEGFQRFLVPNDIDLLPDEESDEYTGTNASNSSSDRDASSISDEPRSPSPGHSRIFKKHHSRRVSSKKSLRRPSTSSSSFSIRKRFFNKEKSKKVPSSVGFQKCFVELPAFIDNVPVDRLYEYQYQCFQTSLFHIQRNCARVNTGAMSNDKFYAENRAYLGELIRAMKVVRHFNSSQSFATLSEAQLQSAVIDCDNSLEWLEHSMGDCDPLNPIWPSYLTFTIVDNIALFFYPKQKMKLIRAYNWHVEESPLVLKECLASLNISDNAFGSREVDFFGVKTEDSDDIHLDDSQLALRTDHKEWSFARHSPEQSLLCSELHRESMALLLASLSHHNVLKLMAAILSDSRIIVTSVSYERIMALFSCILPLLHPLQWQHLIIPMVPSQGLELAQVDLPYIIGVSSHNITSDLSWLPHDAVFVDLDSNILKTPLGAGTLPQMFKQELLGSLIRYGGNINVTPSPSSPVRGRRSVDFHEQVPKSMRCLCFNMLQYIVHENSPDPMLLVLQEAFVRSFATLLHEYRLFFDSADSSDFNAVAFVAYANPISRIFLQKLVTTPAFGFFLYTRFKSRMADVDNSKFEHYVLRCIALKYHEIRVQDELNSLETMLSVWLPLDKKWKKRYVTLTHEHLQVRRSKRSKKNIKLSIDLQPGAFTVLCFDEPGWYHFDLRSIDEVELFKFRIQDEHTRNSWVNILEARVLPEGIRSAFVRLSQVIHQA